MGQSGEVTANPVRLEREKRQPVFFRLIGPKKICQTIQA